MSVNLTPLSARSYSVGLADDPFKKYWWAILAGFIATGAWLCIPVMETSVGSVRVDAAAKPAADAAGEQSLDSAANPSGAPGGALDPSMGGAGKDKSGGGDDMASMLYQGSSEAGAAAAAGKPVDATAASAASLAQQLKDAGKKIADASGWAEKAQRGFDAPHLAGAGLSGAGSLSGHSSASAGGGTNFFGSNNAHVTFGAAGGLQDAGGAESAGFKALKASAGAAAAPNLKGSNEAMQAGMSGAFDGAKGKAPGAIGMNAMAQANAALDAAPANLKTPLNDSKLDVKKLPTPMPAPAPPTSQNMGQQLAMMAATALIGAAVGGLVGGMGGQMVMSMGTMMMQQQQQQTAQQKQAALQNQANQQH